MEERRDARGLTEAEAIARYRGKNYPKPALTADIVVFFGEVPALKLLLIRRRGHPYLGCWALPGGFAEQNEAVEQTAARELREETGLSGLSLRLTGLYSEPGRDPRGWVVSAAYAVWVREGSLTARAGDDAAEAGWFDVRFDAEGALCLTEDPALPLAFDHRKIIEEAARSLGLAGK